MSSARVQVVIPAAGSGSRMGAPLPKQYLPLAGKLLADHTLARLLAVPGIERIQVALHPQDAHWRTLTHAGHARIHTCVGGASRAESVARALAALRAAGASAADRVLVHDMARPCVRVTDIEKLLAVTGADGALLALPVLDTVKQEADGRVAATLDRTHVWRALTPQLFPLGLLERALAKTAGDASITDEASAMEKLGYRPQLVAGSADNIKVTLPADLPLAEFYLQQQHEQQQNGESNP